MRFVRIDPIYYPQADKEDPLSHEMFLAEDFFGKTKNIYEAVMIIARRARQIGEAQRKEMDAYLSQVEMLEKFQDEDDGMIEDAPTPHEPVLQFEKPTILSLREMISDKLQYNYGEEKDELVQTEEVQEEQGLGGFDKIDLSADM